MVSYFLATVGDQPAVVLLLVAAVALFLYGTQHRAPDGRPHVSSWLAAGALGLALVTWYATEWDSPAGRCNRGDIEACAVVFLGETTPAR